MLEEDVGQRSLHRSFSARLGRAHEELASNGIAARLDPSEPDRSAEAHEDTDQVIDPATVKRDRGRQKERHVANGDEEHAGSDIDLVIGDPKLFVLRISSRSGIVGRGCRQTGDEAAQQRMPVPARLGPSQRIVWTLCWLRDESDLAVVEGAILPYIVQPDRTW